MLTITQSLIICFLSFSGMAVVCWFLLALCLYLKITGLQLQYHEIDDTVDEGIEEGDAEDILQQLKIIELNYRIMEVKR